MRWIGNQNKQQKRKEKKRGPFSPSSLQKFFKPCENIKHHFSVKCYLFILERQENGNKKKKEREREGVLIEIHLILFRWKVRICCGKFYVFTPFLSQTRQKATDAVVHIRNFVRLFFFFFFCFFKMLFWKFSKIKLTNLDYGQVSFSFLFFFFFFTIYYNPCYLLLY